MPDFLNTLDWAVSAEAENAFSQGHAQGQQWAQLAEWDLVRYAANDWSLHRKAIHIPTQSGVVTKVGFQASDICGDSRVGDIFQTAFQLDATDCCELILDEVRSSFVLGWQDGVRTIYKQALEKP